jgi:hypothetical protein
MALDHLGAKATPHGVKALWLGRAPGRARQRSTHPVSANIRYPLTVGVSPHTSKP